MCRRPPRAARTAMRGIAAIELAFVISVMLTLVFGVVEVGRVLHAYDTMAKSARAAARYLSAGNPANATRQAEATCVAIYGSPVCGSTPLVPALDGATVTILEPSTNNAVKAVATGAGALDLVTVSISGYSFTSIVSAVFPDLVLGPVSVTVPYVFF